MAPARISGSLLRGHWPVISVILAVVHLFSGCVRVAGNYPRPQVRPTPVTARIQGDGFQLLAGSRLPLEQVEAELDQLKSQGFSRRDPQIIKRVARRKNVPPVLLADRSGNSYYRFTACLDPGVGFALRPGTLKVTVKTRQGSTIVHDHGYLLEDRRTPEGCRPPDGLVLVLGSPETEAPVAVDFLVRLPVRGEIVNLAIDPDRDPTVGKDPLP